MIQVSKIEITLHKWNGDLEVDGAIPLLFETDADIKKIPISHVFLLNATIVLKRSNNFLEFLSLYPRPNLLESNRNEAPALDSSRCSLYNIKMKIII